MSERDDTRTPPGAPAVAELAARCAAPISFAELNRAVELLTHDAKTRLWHPHEAAELPGLMAEAVATVQKATEALRAFLVALTPAKALHDARGEQAPSAVATAAAANAAAAFVSRFQDRAELAAPFVALADMLLDVQIGGHKPRFSRAANAEDVRHPAWWRAAAMGEAAIALDARWRAVTLEAQARTARPPKIGNVARLVAEAIARVFPDHKPGKNRLAGRIVGWRRQAMDGVRGAPKGFKDGHPALELWTRYLANVANNPDLGGRWSAAEWLGFAERTETRILAQVGIKGRVPDEDLPLIASASLRRAS